MNLKPLFFSMVALILILGSCKKSVRKELSQAKAAIENTDYEKVISILTPVLEKNKKAAEAYNLRGTAYYRLNKFKKALEDFNNSIKYGKADYKYYFNRGHVKRNLGDNTGALEDYLKASELNANEYEIYLNKGITLLKLKRNKEALADFNRSVSLNAVDKNNFFYRGKVNRALGNIKGAKKDFEKSVLLDDSFALAHLELAKTEITLNNNSPEKHTCEHLKIAAENGMQEAKALYIKYCK